ncbi:MAG: IS630 family transposase [Candidatus Thiodiazotropha sp.]
MDKTDARKLPLAVLNERRRRAVKLRESGMKLREVAAQVELSIPTVMSAHRAYQAGGWAAVNVKPRGRKRGDGRQLTPEQEKLIRSLICDKTPDQLKLGFALWNRQAVSQLIIDRLGIQLPIRTIGEYLKRWGFTPQKPIKKAYEQRPAEVRQWLDEEYPQIAARAKQEGAEIHWGDETGLRSDDVRGRGYAPKGQTPVVRVNNKREGLSIISTVTNQGKVRWKIFEGAMNADLLIDFFKRLIKDADRKVFLILDNLKVHHARKVKAWLADHEDAIEVFYLPSYSPELNPDECLNADLKDGVTRRAPARSKAQLKKAAVSHLRKLQKLPGRVRKYFEHKPVRYAA